MRRREFLLSGALPIAGLGRRDTGMHCILLKLGGGPSHIDTWDPKPDAPSEIRGPFAAVETNVSGIRISEIFPRMARCAEQYALVRSVSHDSARFHEDASAAMFGGIAGVPFTTVDMSDPAWDCHAWGPFSRISAYRNAAARFDIAFTSLLEDLRRRDLFERTLVVAMGEFGRSPRINPSGGRDHWPHCFTVVMAGAGIRGGQVYGSSDRVGEFPRENPVTPATLAAAVRKTMGLPCEENEGISQIFGIDRQVQAAFTLSRRGTLRRAEAYPTGHPIQSI